MFRTSRMLRKWRRSIYPAGWACIIAERADRRRTLRRPHRVRLGEFPWRDPLFTDDRANTLVVACPAGHGRAPVIDSPARWFDHPRRANRR